MDKLRFYCVKDELVGKFQVPTAMENDEVAKRALKIAANSPEKFEGRENDISLYYVFTLDIATGEVVENNPYLIGHLNSYIGERNNEE